MGVLCALQFYSLFEGGCKKIGTDAMIFIIIIRSSSSSSSSIYLFFLFSLKITMSVRNESEHIIRF